jgi:hypothetical protein
LLINIIVFWDVMSCSLVDRYQRWYLPTKLQSVISQKIVILIFVSYLGHPSLLKEIRIRKWLVNRLVKKFTLLSIPRVCDGYLQSSVL